MTAHDLAPTLAVYLVRAMEVVSACQHHDAAGARYLAKRGLGVPDAVPETEETALLLRDWGHRRRDLDGAHLRLAKAADGLTDGDWRLLFGLMDRVNAPAPRVLS